MKKILLLLMFPICLFSCTKDEGYGPKTYYGNVAVNLATLPNTPTLDVYLNDEKMDTLSLTHALTGFTVTAGDQQRLAIYKANTNTLLADTLFNVTKNANLSYRFAYSEELGLTGFLGDADVAADSVKVQFLYKVNQTLYPYPEADLVIYNYIPTPSPATYTEFFTIKIVYNQLSDAVTLPRIRIPASNTHYWFVYRLKNPVTGEIIRQKFNNSDAIINMMGNTVAYDGRYVIITLTDDGGSETANKFKAIISTL